MSKKMFERSAGVLLNISSLPSNSGVGEFGREAVEFARQITKGGFYWWQTLPITAIGLGNSPYSSLSASAGNFLYISAEYLVEEGLLSSDEAKSFACEYSDFSVNYDECLKRKKAMLQLAFDKSCEAVKSAILDYEKANSWVADYALFMSIKTVNNSAWWKWSEDLKKKEKTACDSFKTAHRRIYDYFLFEQFVFDAQWKKCKSQINDLGVGIIGDMPIYVSLDSVDVWANTDEFLLDEDFRPTQVAGCPPDYFSAEGQLWGNPIYDYAKQKEKKFVWWEKRFERMFELYDCLRIDHFRGFDRYWSVPADAKTAKSGEWKKACGEEIFKLVNKKFKDKKIIAEDLGTLDEGVEKLLEKTGYPGMKVAQFAFSDGDSDNLPHYYNCNTVAYSGTHDNDTTLGWLTSLDDNVLRYTLDYNCCGYENWQKGGVDSDSVFSIINTLIKSSASLVVIPFQDLCGYGSDCRMNIPGTPKSNWTFRATKSAINEIRYEKFARQNGLYGRVRKAVIKEETN